jgi:ubiquinol-cytochrome c reductase cytochrome b subunit
VSRFFYEDRVSPVTPAELEAAHSHGRHDEIEPTAPTGAEAAAAAAAEAGAGAGGRQRSSD